MSDSISIAGSITSLRSEARPGDRVPSAAALRALLLLGCVAVASAAALASEAAAIVRADPELSYLLRGMAAIKACLCAAAVGVLFWRFGHGLSQRSAAAYLIGAWLMTGATMLVWQLSLISLAAMAFHVGEFTLLFTAWRDRAALPERQRGARRAS